MLLRIRLDRITLALLRTLWFKPGDWPAGGLVPLCRERRDRIGLWWPTLPATDRIAPHATERTWTETIRYVDPWIESLHALGLDPVAAAAFTISTDSEGDERTFFSLPEDLRAPSGLEVAEMKRLAPDPGPCSSSSWSWGTSSRWTRMPGRFLTHRGSRYRDHPYEDGALVPNSIDLAGHLSATSQRRVL